MTAIFGVIFCKNSSKYLAYNVQKHVQSPMKDTEIYLLRIGYPAKEPDFENAQHGKA